MGCMHDEAGDHLVARCYLVLEVYAEVGDGGRELSVGPFLAFSGRHLVGKQFGVADEVWGHHLVHRIQVPLEMCLQETPSQCHVLLYRHGGSSLLTRVLSPRGRQHEQLVYERIIPRSYRSIYPQATPTRHDLAEVQLKKSRPACASRR